MTDIPRHKQLYDLLRKHIVDGVYRQGDLLPSENELCQLHNLTRPTVRQALGKLENEGFISKHQGKGSIVQNPVKEIGILSVSGTTSAVGNRNLKTLISIKPVIIPWPEDFMFTLSDLEKESGCIYMERIRLLEEAPIFYDITYIANINLPRITARNFENKSLFNILREHYNIEIRGGEQRIKAIPANEKIGGYLRLKSGHPVLHLERKLETNRAGHFLYSSIYCNTGKYSIFGRF
ncbi:MAG TPA: GntR family transcriptional regulator [Bacteroidales bacterium]|nr:GntR family transcriptional regulator [Bacteroidales bacterium]